MNTVFYNKKHTIFDGFIETVTLTEGLITSYDIDALQRNLIKNFGNRIEIINPTSADFSKNNFDWNTYTFLINVSNINDKLKKQIEKNVGVYGYFIGYTKTIDNKTSLNIEPKYPIVINDILKKDNIYYLYHITHKSNYNKIMKIGLAPRGTETTFFHPDDRIYLMIANLIKVKSFKRVLAKDKNKNVEDFIILKIRYDDKYKYYLDDTSTLKNYGVIGCFVLQNIPPNELELEKS